VSTGTGAARTYTPRANFYGVDSFAFVSSLGCLSSAPAWVKITITPVNDTPKLAPIGNRTVVKGTLLTFTVTANDPDPGQTKTFSLISAPVVQRLVLSLVFSTGRLRPQERLHSRCG
jgi:hypothetical protein